MKKITVFLTIAIFSLIFNPIDLKAAPEVSSEASLPAGKTPVSTEANRLLLRLDEIKSIDKTKLGGTEKRELRKEVRSIKSRLKAIGGGVYLSAGAIIVIVIVLIILL